MKDVHVIVDLQFGSTGKGLFAGYLARQIQPDTVVCAWGPNSGHTYIDENGRKYVHTMVPNGVVSPKLRRVLIGPGAVINPTVMEAELQSVMDHLAYGTVIAIHEAATVVQNRHVQAEQVYGRLIGSTMKGTGAAVAEKITRATPDRPIIARDALQGTWLGQYVVTVEEYNELVDMSELMLIEGSQGFSLSINQGFYPHITSRECTTHQILSDCGIPASYNRNPVTEGHGIRVHGVARTYPIRVANRYDECGLCAGLGLDPALVNGQCPKCGGSGNVMIGTSGPGYPDQAELSWSTIKQEPELTTVTKLPRRLFTFSEQQIREAIRMNGVYNVFLNFANYCLTEDELEHRIKVIQDAGAFVRWLGWGPTVNHIKER